jgi:pimeloyl-ACP methyl ester carboxylesterase
MTAQTPAVATRTAAAISEPIEPTAHQPAARGLLGLPLRFGMPPSAAAGPSASELAYGPATAPRASVPVDSAARIAAMLETATPEVAGRIVFALEDARARSAPGQTTVRVDLPDSLESVELAITELPRLLAVGAHHAGRRSAVPADGQDRMAPSEVLFEQMAHYAQGHDLDYGWLSAQGYELYGDRKREAPYGLTCVAFVPNGARVGAPPLLAFYGTDMQDMRDIRDDALPQCPGFRQVMLNQGMLLDLLSQLRRYGTVAVAGHSLGGANAQLTACLFPDLVASVHTYQSPGISAAMAERMKTYNQGGRQIRSTHYHEDSDIVETVGDAWTEGEFVNYHIPGAHGPIATNLDEWLTGGLGAAGEHALAAHDGMLATRTWLDQHPDVAGRYPDLAKSPEPRAYETGRSATDGVHGANEGMRDAAGRRLLWSPEELAMLGVELDRVESYREDLRNGATLASVLARVDGELILQPLGQGAIDAIKADLRLYASGLEHLADPPPTVVDGPAVA